MNIEIFAHEHFHLLGENATHPLARPVKRLAVRPDRDKLSADGSLLLAYPGRLRRRFVPATRLNVPSDASNCGF